MGSIIVLADDEAELRDVYATILRRDGHDVLEAADGREAIDLVLKHCPDLLVLDIWMPVVNGFEVIEKLRGNPCTNTLKVVLLSNLGDADTRLEAFSAGAVDYWVKGLSLNDLSDRVRRLLDESSSMIELD